MIRILIPLDGSTAAEEALNHALAIAKAFAAELTLLRVTEDADNDAVERRDGADLALSRAQAQSYLDAIAKRFSAEGMNFSGEIIEGHPAESIVKTMVKTMPDLLVLSRYGAGSALRFAAGGTAQKIVSRAESSVLLIDPRRATEQPQAYRRILVPICDSKNSDSAVAVATMIAEIHNASLMLLHVSEQPCVPEGLPDTRHAHKLVNEFGRIVQREAERRLGELAAKIPKQIHVETRASTASEKSLAIESTADENDSELILLHEADAAANASCRCSSVNQSLIQYSHRPLFILQPSAKARFSSNSRSVDLRKL